MGKNRRKKSLIETLKYCKTKIKNNQTNQKRIFI